MNADDGLTLEDYIFNESYNHLDINTVTDELFKNFNVLEITREKKI